MQVPRVPSRTSLHVLFIVALAGAATLAMAGPMGHGDKLHERHHGKSMELMFDHLDLTADQQAQARETIAQYQEANEANKDRMRLFHEKLAELIHAEYFDEAAIRDAAEAVGAAQAELIVAHATLFRDVRQFLTFEQLDKLRGMGMLHRGVMELHGDGGFGHGLHEDRPERRPSNR